jgi:aquaporin Z
MNTAVNDAAFPVESAHSSAKRRRDFDDPKLEWQRLFAEVFGTFFLVVVAAGADVVNAVSLGEVGRVAAVVAPGLMVMAIILFMGAVSGAHLNPAVSIGFAARGDFPWRRVPGYIAAQLLGAAIACAFLWLMFGKAGMLGASEPGPGISDIQAMMMELVLTLGLVSTILGTASKAQSVGPLAALAVGGYIALAGLWGSPISGASMNPARSFGPDLVLLNFSRYWVYVVGPIAGALLAVVAAYALRGRGGDAPAVEAAQGRPEASPDLPAKRVATKITPIQAEQPRLVEVHRPTRALVGHRLLIWLGHLSFAGRGDWMFRSSTGALSLSDRTGAQMLVWEFGRIFGPTLRPHRHPS